MDFFFARALFQLLAKFASASQLLEEVVFEEELALGDAFAHLHQILETEGKRRVNWDVRQGVFPEGYIESSFELLKENVFKFADSEGLKSIVTSRLPECVKKVRKEANSTDEDIEVSYLYEGFLRSLKNTPKAPALYSKGVSYSYEELSDYVVTLRKELVKAGFKKGDKVALSISFT